MSEQAFAPGDRVRCNGNPNGVVLGEYMPGMCEVRLWDGTRHVGDVVVPAQDLVRMHTFVLRTRDKAWIKRNGGVADAGGRVTIQVAEVEAVTFAGVPHLRTRLVDVPKDVANGWVVCPAAWVEK